MNKKTLENRHISITVVLNIIHKIVILDSVDSVDKMWKTNTRGWCLPSNLWKHVFSVLKATTDL